MSIVPGILPGSVSTSLRSHPVSSPPGRAVRRRRAALLALAVLLGAALLVVTVASGARAASSGATGAVPLPDYNEPNDSYDLATALENGVLGWGAITSATDADYFYIDLPGSSEVTVEFTTRGYLRDCDLFFEAAGTDTPVELSAWDKRYDDDGSFTVDGTLAAGTLYLVVTLGNGFAGTTAYNVTVTYSGTDDTATFSDVPAGSDYYSAITYLAGEGVVSGYSDGRFGPSDLVTRQQFAKMIVRAVGYAVFTSDVCPFTDVSTSYPGHYVDPNDPLYPDHYIAVAAEHQITVGMTATTFGPYQNIKMAQVTTMVVRTAEDLGLWDSPPHAYTPPFADFGEPHYSYAREGAAHGLFDGYKGSWDWFSPATRGQCAFFIWKLMLAYHPGGGGPEPVY